MENITRSIPTSIIHFSKVVTDESGCVSLESMPVLNVPNTDVKIEKALFYVGKAYKGNERYVVDSVEVKKAVYSMPVKFFMDNAQKVEG